MAVFMINICKFNGCGITFPSLGDLIQHIEDTHIDYDPLVIEQKEASQPSCIPLSYVLRFFTEASRKEFQSLPPVPDVRKRVVSAPKTPSIRSSTPTGSELDDEEMMTPSEDSNDSWTTIEEFSSEFILRYGVKINGTAAVPAPAPAPGTAHHDKPFACPVPGCKKRYKNVNGIKYHSKNGHKKDGKVKKAYKCHCGKSYTTAQGLKSHSVSHHITGSQSASLPVSHPVSHPVSLPDSKAQPIRSTPGLVVTASNTPPSRPLSLDHIDATKLVRIYDSLKPKDLSNFHIPKLNKDNPNTSSQVIRNLGLLTPSSTPGSSPPDKRFVNKTHHKLTVHSGNKPQTIVTSSQSNEHIYITKMVQ